MNGTTTEDCIADLDRRMAAHAARQDQIDAELHRLVTTLRFMAGHLLTALERVNA